MKVHEELNLSQNWHDGHALRHEEDRWSHLVIVQRDGSVNAETAVWESRGPHDERLRQPELQGAKAVCLLVVVYSILGVQTRPQDVKSGHCRCHSSLQTRRVVACSCLGD